MFPIELQQVDDPNEDEVINKIDENENDDNIPPELDIDDDDDDDDLIPDSQEENKDDE